MNFAKAAVAPAFLLLAGCVTYPYQSAFDACDAEAGACYRYCEDVADNDYEYGACHADCEAGANQCFASAYDSYAYNSGPAYGGSYYQPSWPWYGRYGAWGPTNGYYFDFSYYGGSSRYDRPRRRGYYGSGPGRNRGGYDQPSGPPPQGRPPRRNDGEGGGRGRPGRDGSGTPPPRSNDAPPPRRNDPPPVQPAPPVVQQPSPPPASTPARPQKPRTTPRNKDDVPTQEY